MGGESWRSIALRRPPSRIAEVAHGVLDAAGRPDVDAPLAALLHAQEDVVLHLHVPGVVVLAGLEHRPGGRGRVTSALHLERVEERPVGHVVRRVELGPHDVAGPEVHDAVGAGAHGLQVRRRLPGLGALEILEHVLGHDHAAVAAEGVGPEGLGPAERDLDGVAIDLVDPRDLAIRAHGHGGGARVGHELPREDHVVGTERLAVVPGARSSSGAR